MRAVRNFEPTDLSPGVYRMGDEVGADHVPGLLEGSFVRTLTVDGEVAAVFGMRVRWAGVADVWAVVTDHARGHGLWLTKTANRLILQFARELQLHRVGSIVKETQEENVRWMGALGFHLEGIEWVAGPEGENLLRFVRWTGTTNLTS